jgi:regulator of sirC expression with transglutaminase-like and TPR domain
MTSYSQLPFLLQLLEDNSDPVREEVRAALFNLGLSLRHQVAPYLKELDPQKRKRLDEIWGEIRKAVFQERWQKWMDEQEEPLALELALGSLALLDSGLEDPDLADQLDELADSFHELGEPASIPLLMRFLFRIEGFKAPEREYYHARNSNMVKVIRRKEGLQISLSCLAILLGKRVGLELYGFNMPGHFMVMSEEKEVGIRVYDVFSQGRALHPNSIDQLAQALELKSGRLHHLRARPHEIVLRVLRNIIKAHERKGNYTEAAKFKVHFERLIGELKERGL